METAKASSEQRTADSNLKSEQLFVGASLSKVPVTTQPQTGVSHLRDVSFVINSSDVRNNVPTAQANQSPDPAVVEAQQLKRLQGGVTDLTVSLDKLRDALSSTMREPVLDPMFARVKDDLAKIQGNFKLS